MEGPGAALSSSLTGDLLFNIVNNQGQSSSFIHGLGNNQSSQFVESSTAAADRVPARESRAAARSAASGVESEVNPHQQHKTAAAGAVPSPASGTAVCAPSTRRDLPHAAPDAVFASSSIKVAQGAASMDVETDERLFLEMPAAETRGGYRLVPIPDLLQLVLASETGNIRQPSAYLILAVHAIMLETGFVRVETSYSNSVATSASAPLEGYGLPSGWSAGSLVNLTYTLPELKRGRESLSSSGTALGEEALLRCQIVGNAVVVYGAVTGGNVHRVSLSVSKFLRENLQLQMLVSPAENSSSSNSNQRTKESGTELENVEPMVSGDCLEQGEPSEGRNRPAPVTAASMGETHEENIFRNIFELWKEVKDSLSLPLLSFMCERAGLPPPPSLLRVPTELIIKVLDSLPSIALANISCACSELRFLAASEELWKQKYKEEFGAGGQRAPGRLHWDSAFLRDSLPPIELAKLRFLAEGKELWMQKYKEEIEASGERAPGGRGWKSAFVRESENWKEREEKRREAERFNAKLFPPELLMRCLDYYYELKAELSRGGGFGAALRADVGPVVAGSDACFRT